MARVDRTLRIQTALFPTDPEGDLELSNGSPGSHFAQWLRDGLSTRGHRCDAVIQEDYGWGFWVDADGLAIWVCVGYCTPDPGPINDLPEWGIIVEHDASIFQPKQWFRKKEGSAAAEAIYQDVQALVKLQPELIVAEEGL